MIRKIFACPGNPPRAEEPLFRATRRGEGFGPALRLVGAGQRRSFLWLIVARTMVGVCDLLLAIAMYLLFSLLQGATPSHYRLWTPRTTLSAALATAALLLLRALMDLVSTRAVVGHVQTLYTEILLRLTNGYNEMQWIRFARRNRSELLNHSMNTAREASNFYHLRVELVASVIVLILMTVALVDRSPAAACSFGAAVGVFYAVHRFLIRGKLQRAAVDREQASRVLQRTLADMLASGREIRSYGAAAFFHDRIAAHARTTTASFQRVTFLPQVARIVTDQGVVLLFLAIVIVAQLRHDDTRQLLSLLVFYFVLSRRMLPLISQISFMAGQMEGAYKSVQIVENELNECLTYRMEVSLATMPTGDSVLEVDQVSFSFDEGTALLRDVTFCLCQGETVVLQGVSGSGKSSLLNLVAGILQPLTGVVRVDRTKIAYVPQEIGLLDDSIRSNLLFGMTRRSDAELMKALTIANLKKFVDDQPLGLDSAVGDNGVLLSGGQRQRLGVARAVLRGARLLLLDEATSALDEANESQVLENLNASGVAVLLVTHRVRRHPIVRRVLRLEEGHVVEEASQERSVPEKPLQGMGQAR